MIFLPYILILRDSDETFQTLKEVQEIQSNFTAVRNDTTELISDLEDNPIRIKTFFERLIGNSINYYDNCLKGNYDSNPRLIQTTDNEVGEVMQNIRDNNLWYLDVCNRLNITKPPVFGTVLHFYRSNISDPTRAYATLGPDRDKEYLSRDLTKEQVSTLEYYNASFHVGSPFWLNLNSQYHIKSIFSEYNYSLNSIDRQISDVNRLLGNIEIDVIDKYPVSKSINDSKEELDELKNSLGLLHQTASKMIPNVLEVFNLGTLDDTPLNNATHIKLLSAIVNETQLYSDSFKSTIGRTQILIAVLDRQREIFENIISSLNDRLKQLEIRKNETSNRLKEIEFPFGSVPMGINESILFFPVGISAGFWISASLLGNTLRLRKHYDDILTRDMVKSIKRKVDDINTQVERTKKKKKKIDQKLSLLYPVWIDPITSRPLRAVKLVILSVPAIIFVASIYVLYDNWQIIISQQDLEGLFIGNSRDNVILYYGSHAISTIFFISGYWIIFKELKH